MKTILLLGASLTDKQVMLLPFKGAKNPKWIINHSFYFSEDGELYTTNQSEYYPICKSLSHLPY